MKLQATIGDHTTDLDVRIQGNRVHAELEGRDYELDLYSTGKGLLLVVAGRVFECHVEGRPEPGSAVEVIVGPNHFGVTLNDPKRLRSAVAAGMHADEAARIVAPMPGKVVRVLVGAGAQVEVGTGIVVVEAMKMQNEMKSPKAGTVAALNVEVGATVNGGDVLAVIE